MNKFLALLATAFFSASVALPVSASDSPTLDAFANASLTQPASVLANLAAANPAADFALTKSSPSEAQTLAYFSWYTVYICAVNPGLPICKPPRL
jgi:hypothetical protein